MTTVRGATINDVTLLASCRYHCQQFAGRGGIVKQSVRFLATFTISRYTMSFYHSKIVSFTTLFTAVVYNTSSSIFTHLHTDIYVDYVSLASGIYIGPCG